MKKLFFIIMTVAFIGTTFTSCRSNKPPCPAYNSSHTKYSQVDLQHHNDQTKSEVVRPN